MTQRMKEIADQIVGLQAELDREIERRRKVLGWALTNKIGEFEMGVAAEHRRLRLNLVKFFGRTSPAVVLTAPVIYSLIIPLVIVDAWVSAYQAICFRAYGIPRVRAATTSRSTAVGWAISMSSNVSTAPFAATPTGWSPMCARSPAEPSNTGARSNTP